MADLQATIVHDLAGHMTSISGLSEIVAERPDMDSRESLIVTLADEAKAATQAVRDLQTVRSLASGSVAEDVRSVSAEEWFELVKQEIPGEVAEALAPPAGVPPVRADAETLASLIARLLVLAEPPGDERWSVTSTTGSVEISIAMGGTDRSEDLEQGRLSGRKEMRPLALADLLLPRWDARMGIEGKNGSLFVTLFLRTA